jgi:hypothetical protein
VLCFVMLRGCPIRHEPILNICVQDASNRVCFYGHPSCVCTMFRRPLRHLLTRDVAKVWCPRISGHSKIYTAFKKTGGKTLHVSIKDSATAGRRGIPNGALLFLSALNLSISCIPGIHACHVLYSKTRLSVALAFGTVWSKTMCFLAHVTL